MLKMRLQRIGRKNEPTYRVLVVDSRQGPKSGKFIDQIGSYDPKAGKPQIDTEKAKKWIAEGVQVSGTVHNMLVDLKVINGKKVNVLPKKTPIVKEEEPAEEAPVTEETSADGEASEVGASEESKVEEVAEEKKEENTEEAAPEEPKAEEAPEAEEKKEESAAETEEEKKETAAA